MRLHAVGQTDIGNVRAENQDSFLVETGACSESRGSLLAVVADGVGGGKAGNIASRIAVDTLKGICLESDSASEDLMRQAIEAANLLILERSASDELCRGMATTCTALMVKDDSAIIGHVGDSRAYRIRDGEISHLTEDHTLPRKLFKEGVITEDEIELHPQGNVLTNAVGSKGKMEVDIISTKVRERDAFILCSDGMYKYLKDHEIKEIVSNAGVEVSPEKLIATAKERGGDDNITVVVIEAIKEGFGKTTQLLSTYKEEVEPPQASGSKKGGFGGRVAVFILLAIGLILLVLRKYH